MIRLARMLWLLTRLILADFIPFAPTIGNITPPLPVAQGGTGAATAAGGLAALGGLGLQAATPVGGFALQNGTPTIISWTAPNDGQNHRVLILGEVNVTVLEAGGAIQAAYTPPAGGAQTATLSAGTLGVSVSALTFFARVVAPGSTVQVNQSSALTSGTATVWAEIWGL